MLKSPNILLLFFVLASLGMVSQTQTKSFKVIHKNKACGMLTIARSENKGVVEYYSKTSINANILFKDIQVDYEYRVYYHNNVFNRSDVGVYINGKLHSKSITVKKADGYELSKDEKEPFFIANPIKYSSIRLYFSEPSDAFPTYSEQHGTFDQIVPVSKGVYQKIDNKNRTNTYHYEEGVLKRADIDGGLVKFQLISHG